MKSKVIIIGLSLFIVVVLVATRLINEWSKEFNDTTYQTEIRSCQINSVIKNGSYSYIWCDKGKILMPSAIDESNREFSRTILVGDFISKQPNTNIIVVKRNNQKINYHMR